MLEVLAVMSFIRPNPEIAAKYGPKVAPTPSRAMVLIIVLIIVGVIIVFGTILGRRNTDLSANRTGQPKRAPFIGMELSEFEEVCDMYGPDHQRGDDFRTFETTSGTTATFSLKYTTDRATRGCDGIFTFGEDGKLRSISR